MFLVYHFFAFLARRLPAPVTRRLALALATLRYLTTPGLRRRLRANYRAVIDRAGRPPAELEKMVWRGYLNFALYLLEFLSAPAFSRANIRSRVNVRGEEHLREAFARGKGVISLTAHLGNWEMAGVATALLGYPVTAVALAQSDARVNRFFLARRRAKGVRIVLLGKSPRALISALRRNELVALLGDRVFAPPTLRATFFGREAILPAGPVQLAVRTGAAVVPGFMVREKNRLTLCFEPPITPRPSLSRDEAAARLAADYVACLERYIARYPEQWLVFNRIWNGDAAGKRLAAAATVAENT